MQRRPEPISLASPHRPSWRHAACAAVLGLGGLLLAGCGQKGPLELPLPARPSAATNVPPPPVLQPAAAASAPSPSR